MNFTDRKRSSQFSVWNADGASRSKISMWQGGKEGYLDTDGSERKQFVIRSFEKGDTVCQVPGDIVVRRRLHALNREHAR